MAEWTHRVCERCWFDGYEDLPPPGVFRDGELAGAYRQPSQVSDVEPGACCYCGGMTITGIFLREQEDRLKCRGRHEDVAAWSRVAVQ